ncbi:hypothetical protein HYW43_05320 [Candidatus Daviesbacteria bacterium]|nr:hypothetical protein [Candidatus Daviesbacteria bacterium]
MDDPRWLRLVTIGLVLAALAVGYFLFSGGMTVNKTGNTPSSTVKPGSISSSPSPSNNPSLSLQPQSSATQSAFSRISGRAQPETQTLPRTGFPVGLAIVFSISAMISGFSLRKFPK